MKKIFLIVAALSLASCSTLQQFKNVAETVGEFNVSPQAVILASNTFDALEITATNYLRLPRCKSATTSPVCRSPTASALLIPAVRSGRVARDNLQQFIKDHPNQLASATVYEKFTSIISTIQGVYAQYNVGG